MARLVPIWMKSELRRQSAAAKGRAAPASAVPTTTGAIEAASVRGRAAIHHTEAPGRCSATSLTAASETC